MLIAENPMSVNESEKAEATGMQLTSSITRSLYDFPMVIQVCPEWVDGGDEEYCPDEYEIDYSQSGPATTGWNITITSTLTNALPGWNFCYNFGNDAAAAAIENHNQQSQLGLVSGVPQMVDFAKNKLGLADGGTGALDASTIRDSFYGLTSSTNSSQPIVTPAALVCGPKSPGSSTYNWKVILGKSVKLPKVNSWSRQ